MDLLNFVISISIPTLCLGIFALGLNLKWGFSGLIDFGHVVFLSLGAYTAIILSLNGFPLLLSCLAGIILSAIAGALLGSPALRLRDDYLAIVTLGFAHIFNQFLLNEEWLTRGTLGLHGFERPLQGIIPTENYNYFLIVLGILGIILVYLLLEKLVNSPWGRVLKSIREDEIVSSALGKNVFSYKIQAMALGSGIAGFAGIILAFYYQYINPHMFAHTLTFESWIAIVLGGSANNRGTILGSILIWGLLLNGTRILSGYIPLESTQLGAIRIMIIGFLLILLMRFKPEGILGDKEELAL